MPTLHRRICLDTWSLIVATLWKDLESMALWEMVFLSVHFGFSKAHAFPSSSLCLFFFWRCKLSAIAAVPCLRACCHIPDHDGHRLSSHCETISNNTFLLKLIVLVIKSYHTNRKVTTHLSSFNIMLNFLGHTHTHTEMLHLS